ncbi:MAG TPA: CoA transferase, partial [Dehalococcoidia bacterium]|nr:CoA transferase [Dehalococcoidia bacterium]
MLLAGPLSGLRVIEIGHYIPAPYAAMLLSDLGAAVTKIERPGGAPDRDDPGYQLFNRGKSVRRIDLKSPAGRIEARALVREADVLIENLRPGALDRLGLGADELRAADPRLIYASITPYGRRRWAAGVGPGAKSGRDLVDETGWDSLVAARAGIPEDQGVGRPVWVTLPAASYASALLTVYAVLGALHRRHETGRGDHVDMSLYAAALGFQAHGLVAGPGFSRLPNTSPQGSNPLYRLYRCADDRWIFVACGNPGFVLKLGFAIGADDLLTRPEYAGCPWGIAPEHQATVFEHLSATFATRAQADWLRILDEADVPCAPVQTALDYFRDPQARHNGAIVDIDHPVLGPTQQMGALISFRLPPDSSSPSPTPVRSERAFLQPAPQTSRLINPVEGDKSDLDPPSPRRSAGKSGPRGGGARSVPDTRNAASSALAGLRVLDLS